MATGRRILSIEEIPADCGVFALTCEDSDQVIQLFDYDLTALQNANQAQMWGYAERTLTTLSDKNRDIINAWKNL